MLTIEKQKFAIEYLKCFNAPQAALLAGFEAKKGSRLLKDKDVVNYLKDSLNKVNKDAIITGEELMIFLSNVIRGTEKEYKYFVLKNGNNKVFNEIVVEKEVSPEIRDRLKSAELMCKVLNLLTGKNETDTPSVIFNMNVPLKNT